MKRSKKFIFLPVIMAAVLMLGACGQKTNDKPSDPEQTDPSGDKPVATFVVSFGANGGTGTMADVKDVSGEYTLPECKFTAPEGKRFAGWKVNGEGNLLAVGAKITVIANVELVAQWEDIPTITFTVSFGANGGTGTMADVPNIAGSYLLPANGFTAPEGKYFAGWKVGGTGDLLQPGETINVSGDVQIVAQWDLVKYTVSFDANGGTGKIADVTDVLGEFELPENGFNEPEGKQFIGWKVNGEGDLLQPGAKIDVTADVRLVAQYDVVKYTVQFKVDGENYGEPQLIAHGGKVTKPDDPTKAPTGEVAKFRFAGWDKDLDAEITENTVINAIFAEYASEMKVDDFESYSASEDLIDAGWKAIGWSNTTNGWSEDTKAAVSLGYRSVEGDKSLRFDAWRNGSTYKIRKDFEESTFGKDANAIQVRFMAPRGVSLNIMFTVNADVYDPTTQTTKNMDVEFQNKFTLTTSEFVQYTIPFNDSNWKAWGEQGKTIQVLANAVGMSEDDVVKTTKRLEFSLTGNDGGINAPYIAYLDSVKFVTLDNPQRTEVETIESFSTYTGVSNSGNVVKIDLGAEGAATASVIDLETPLNIPGHIALDGKNITFTSDDEGATLVYTGEIAEGGKEIKFVSANGAMKDAVNNMVLNAVQMVENYEQYTSDGQAYCQKYSDKNARSGARGAYFSEYYSGSGSSPWGGNGWSLMGGEGDQLKLKNDGAGHNGSKNYLCMKNSASFGMRYMQWGLFDGSSEQQSYRGSKLGFWIRSYGRIPEIKVSMYSKSNPTAATKDQNVKTVLVNPVGQISSWTHYEVDLNPLFTYYGFMIFIEKNLVSDSYLYLDDVEVYTANPYATYTSPIDVQLEQGSSYSAAIGGTIRAQLDIVDDTNLKLSAPGLNMTVPGTYVVANNELTATLYGGTVYKASIAADLSKLTFKSVEGGDATIAGALNNLSFVRRILLEDAESYTESGKMYYQSNKDESQISGARGAYYCEYYTGNDSNSTPVSGSKWNLMGGSGDQLSLEQSMGANGSSQSLKLKRSSAGAMRYMQWDLFKGTTIGYKGYKRLVAFLKNPSSTAITVKLHAYRAYQAKSSNSGYKTEAVYTIPANTDWAPYTITLDPNNTYYGFGILLEYFNGDTAYLYADDIYLDTVAADYNFVAKSNAVLNGKLNDAADASITIVNATKLQISCAALGLTDKEATYKMGMRPDGKQVMEFTIEVGDNSVTVVAEYKIDQLGKASLEVLSATGALASQITIGNIFAE